MFFKKKLVKWATHANGVIPFISPTFNHTPSYSKMTSHGELLRHWLAAWPVTSDGQSSVTLVTPTTHHSIYLQTHRLIFHSVTVTPCWSHLTFLLHPTILPVLYSVTILSIVEEGNIYDIWNSRDIIELNWSLPFFLSPPEVTSCW